MRIEEWLGTENQLGLDIWHRKYQRNNEDFEAWLDRVSDGYPEIRELIKERKFLPGGRIMSNIGIDDDHSSLMNCYSRGFINDDYNDIMQAASDIGKTFKAQGGQGLSLSKLRPKGAPIGKGYASDGIVPFMKIYNEVTEGTSQGGARKGALMISLDAWHAEAMNFITIKSKDGLIEKANISLEIDDEFMECVDKYYQTGEEITMHRAQNYSGHIVTWEVKPIEIFKAMIANNYDWGDPGCLFVNRFRNYNIMEYVDDYQIETCNPCGEQPLPKNMACCLSSLNLAEFVRMPYTPNAYFDKPSFLRAITAAVKYLDHIVDLNSSRHPLEEQRINSRNWRNIGLGVFGYGSALMRLGLKYGSAQANIWTDFIFDDLFKQAVITSSELAKEFGTFPKYSDKVWDSTIIQKHFTSMEIEGMKYYGLRNCSLISIAPTGSLATMLGETGGCEPEYAISFTRRTVGLTDNEDHYYKVYCKAAREYMEINNTDELPDYFIGSSDINPFDRVTVQSIMQNHVDTAISSTINLPESATKEQMEQIYLDGWKKGLKGLTIFRDNCKKLGILTTSTTKTSDSELELFDELKRGEINKCSDALVGKKRKIQTGCGSLHVQAWFDPNTCALQEIYLSKGSTGGCQNFMVGLSRMISLACRAGVNIHDIKDQLDSTGACPSYAARSATKHDTSKGACCPMAIGNVLLEMWEEMKDEYGDIVDQSIEIKQLKKKTTINEKAKCPECGAVLVHEGGCDVCKECGFSHCS